MKTIYKEVSGILIIILFLGCNPKNNNKKKEIEVESLSCIRKSNKIRINFIYQVKIKNIKKYIFGLWRPPFSWWYKGDLKIMRDFHRLCVLRSFQAVRF